MSASILIADDHPLFREALTQIIGSALPDYKVQQARDYAEVRKVLEAQEFAFVFVDLDMPESNGLSELVLLKKLCSAAPLTVISAHESEHIIQKCLEFGAHSYIVKSTPPTEIKAAVETIAAGQQYLPPEYAQAHLAEATEQETSALSSLTPSQMRVLLEIGKGKLNKQIAYDLEITEATVKAHITSIFRKLGINNRTQAVLIAREHSASIPTPN